MKCILKVGCVAICLILSNIVLAVDCNSQCQLTQIEAYFTALDKMSRKGSSINDIDTLLSLTHDDVEYIHVAYGAHFTKVVGAKRLYETLNGVRIKTQVKIK
ncbi:hypothetical protein [Shewanella sp. HL-SH2]|uniref:hypothetical protein n=1 Tax=Shewanella sp. HL-SH2 TaxID=3436238 RepID=UPI003EB7F466